MRWSSLSLLGVLFFSGCAGVTPRGPAGLETTPAMVQAFGQAEKLYYAKRFADAGLRYRSYLNQFPTNGLTTKAYFRLGEIALNGGNEERAVGYYDKSLARGIPPEWGPTALYKKAVTHSRLEEFKKVFQTLDRFPSEGAEGGLLVRVGSLRVSAARKLAKREDKAGLQEIRGYLELIDGYGRLAPSEREIGDLNWIVSEKRAVEAVRDWANNPDQEVGDLKDFEVKWEGRSSASYILWEIASRAHQKGDYDESNRQFQRFLLLYPKHEYAARTRGLVTELEKREPVTRQSVGVVLPLSGPYGVYGESVLHGLECAAGIFQPCRGDLGLNLIVRDTGGDPKIAARAIREFLADPNVRVVIGPLPQVEVDEAARVAESGGLPMVTLSQKKGVVAIGNFIFRNFLTVEDQVATIVQYACEEKGWKDFGVLYPGGAAGEEYAKTFEEEVERCGGKVVAKAGYASGTRDFSESLRILKSSAARQTADQKIPFDAIFIPDVYRRIPAILEGLRFLQMDQVPLLGGAGWDHPGLVEGGLGKVPEGAVFVNGFFDGSGVFATKDFVSTFNAAYGVVPTLLEAYAYDTLRLVGQVLRAHPTASREAVRETLSKIRGFDGVTGSISFDDEGDARRRLFVLTVRQGQIREVR